MKLNFPPRNAGIFIGGETGTLEEFCIAVYEGKVIGVLEKSGGVCDKIQDVMSVCPTNHGAIIIYESDYKKLLSQVLKHLEKRGAKR